MNPLRIYLAGPMTGYPLYNYPAFHAAAAQLRAQGHVVLNPAELDLDEGFDPSRTLEDQGFDWAEVMERDLQALVTTQAIALLPGAQGSTGAMAEYEVARALGLRLFAVIVNPMTGDYVLAEGTPDTMDEYLARSSTPARHLRIA